MSSLSIQSDAASQLAKMLPQQSGVSVTETPRFATGKQDELREQFTQFVGESFYGQMLKAMRATVGKPAYFHGGRAEEVFQGQLDQQMAQHLTEASAEKFAEPLFERQFPHLANKNSASDLNQLTQLRRM